MFEVMRIVAWWVHQDSNLGPAGYEPVALTAELWTRTGDSSKTASLPYFDAISDLHRLSHQHDLRSRGVAFGCEHRNLAKNLTLRYAERDVAEDGEELARLHLIVAAEVDLHELTDSELCQPIAAS